MKGFDTFKNALTFETKRLCVSTKAPLRFNQNSLAFYLERKGFEKNAKEVFQKEKTAPQSLAKGLYNAVFLTKHPFY